MVLFTFDREDVFFPLLTNAFDATFLLTAFFFGCFFGLGFFTMAFLLVTISYHRELHTLDLYLVLRSRYLLHNNRCISFVYIPFREL